MRTAGAAGKKLPEVPPCVTLTTMDSAKGLLLVFTGNGKGKTSAAMGVALRAVGQGLKVLMIQFIKGSWHYGELDGAAMLGGAFEIRPMGRGFVKIGSEKPDLEDVRLCEEGWDTAVEMMNSDRYDMLILDELNYVVNYGMLPIDRVLEGLAARPERLHVIATGRNAHPRLVEAADLVSEIKEIKHPFQRGILAQRGIDY
jgi:cob(I)alamin adenosyltransferase